MLLLYMEEPMAYACMEALAASHCVGERPAEQHAWRLKAAEAFFERELPDVHAHLSALGVPVSAWLPEWCARHSARLHTSQSHSRRPDSHSHLPAPACPPSKSPPTSTPLLRPRPAAAPLRLVRFATLFMSTLPLDTAARVWDCYLRDGEPLLWRVAFALLQLLAPRLLRECQTTTACLDLLTQARSTDAVHEKALFQLLQAEEGREEDELAEVSGRDCLRLA